MLTIKTYHVEQDWSKDIIISMLYKYAKLLDVRQADAGLLFSFLTSTDAAAPTSSRRFRLCMPGQNIESISVCPCVGVVRIGLLEPIKGLKRADEHYYIFDLGEPL